MEETCPPKKTNQGVVAHSYKSENYICVLLFSKTRWYFLILNLTSSYFGPKDRVTSLLSTASHQIKLPHQAYFG
jgi:hypothetical protein